jgi:hypothetical protein
VSLCIRLSCIDNSPAPSQALVQFVWQAQLSFLVLSWTDHKFLLVFMCTSSLTRFEQVRDCMRYISIPEAADWVDVLKASLLFSSWFTWCQLLGIGASLRWSTARRAREDHSTSSRLISCDIFFKRISNKASFYFLHSAVIGRIWFLEQGTLERGQSWWCWWLANLITRPDYLPCRIVHRPFLILWWEQLMGETSWNPFMQKMLEDCEGDKY